MAYPCKGRKWFYIGTGLMMAWLGGFLWTIWHLPHNNIGICYAIFLPCFLAAGILRIYAITPLMSPKLGGVVVAALFAASQVFTIFFWFGHFILGYIIGHFVELGTFSWAYHKSRKLYEQQPL